MDIGIGGGSICSDLDGVLDGKGQGSSLQLSVIEDIAADCPDLHGCDEAGRNERDQNNSHD